MVTKYSVKIARNKHKNFANFITLLDNSFRILYGPKFIRFIVFACFLAEPLQYIVFVLPKPVFDVYSMN